MRESTRSLTALGLMMLVLVGQGIGMVRYGQRLPGDRLGFGLYVVTIACAAAVALMLFLRWREAIRHD